MPSCGAWKGTGRRFDCCGRIARVFGSHRCPAKQLSASARAVETPPCSTMQGSSWPFAAAMPTVCESSNVGGLASAWTALSAAIQALTIHPMDVLGQPTWGACPLGRGHLLCRGWGSPAVATDVRRVRPRPSSVDGDASTVCTKSSRSCGEGLGHGWCGLHWFALCARSCCAVIRCRCWTYRRRVDPARKVANLDGLPIDLTEGDVRDRSAVKKTRR